MTANFPSSPGVPPDVRDLYETLPQATGRSKNDIMVEVLRAEGERRVRDLALILEGQEQARNGRVSSLADVVARFRARSMLPADFELAADDAPDG